MNQKPNELNILQHAQKIIFSLEKKNISQSTLSLIDIFDDNFKNSFNIVITQMIYSALIIRITDFDIYLDFINEIDKANNNKTKIFDAFIQFLLQKNKNESYYILANLIEKNINITKEIRHDIHVSLFVRTRKFHDEFSGVTLNDVFENIQVGNLIDDAYQTFERHDNIEWVLIREGFNPNEIAKIIRNDEIEKLQEISSQTNFDFNQIIEPSLYERCDFINQFNVTLIDYAAFFSSVKCFKHLLVNGANIENTCKYAIAGGNLEIIHLCEQNHSKFENTYETAIIFHRNDVFKYIYENKLEKLNTYAINLGYICIKNGNYKIFSYLEELGMKIDDFIITESEKLGNLYITKYFIQNNPIPKGALFTSVESRNVELVEYILEQKGIYINAKDICLF